MAYDNPGNSGGKTGKKGSGEYVEFVPPKDFRAPATTAENKEFDVVCTFRPSEGGKLCMVKLGETPMPEAPKGEDKEKTEETTEEGAKPDYSKMANSIVSGVNEGREPMEGGA